MSQNEPSQPPSGDVEWIATHPAPGVRANTIVVAARWFEAREKAMQYFGCGPGDVAVVRRK